MPLGGCRGAGRRRQKSTEKRVYCCLLRWSNNVSFPF